MALELSSQLRQHFQQLKKRYPSLRSALIPMLLRAQDELGYISDDLVTYLAGELNLRRLQVDEVISYYSMLRRKPAGKFHLQVCTNVACMLRGGYPILEHVSKRCGVPPKSPTADGTFSYEEVECLGACTGAPVVQVNYDYYEKLTVPQVDTLMDQLRAGKKPTPVPFTSGVQLEPHPAEVRVISRRFGVPDSASIDTYLQQEGYQALEKALKQMTPEQIIEEVKRSNLRGRGGAGFPAGMKWSFVPKETDKPKYVIANADEGDPGAFMNRSLLEGDPHSMLEGLAIAGYAIGAGQGYVYARAEYPLAVQRLRNAIGQMREAGLLGRDILGSGFSLEIDIREGAGAFVCG